MVDEDKVKQEIRKSPWNIYYAHDKFKNTFEIMKECVELDPNTYQYSSLHLIHNVELALLFLRKGGSFSMMNKHLRNNKTVGMLAVELDPKSFQYVGKTLKDDDDVFKLAIQQDKNMIEYASERLRKIIQRNFIELSNLYKNKTVLRGDFVLIALLNLE